MESAFLHYMLMGIGIVGSMAAFSAAQRIFSTEPEEDASSLRTIAKKQAGEASIFDGINPSGGLIDRLDFFLARRLGLARALDEMHMLLGRPATPTPLQMLHFKEIAAFFVPALAFYLMDFFPAAWILAPVAFWMPDFYFKGRIQERQRQIIRNFPTMVDLAALTIESGLDYMSAFDRIIKSASKKTDLETEMEKTLSEVQLGYSRREALRRLAMRTGLQEIRSFVGLIIQSDELGTSLVDLLRNYSSDMRFRRLNKAEKAAAQAATKMLIPIILFIFPTVFILTLAPMLKNLFQGGLGF